MATGQMSGVIGYLSRTALLQDHGAMTDGQLLDCFVARRDEAAFEALVRRHGPMVLGVCQRILRHTQDAEDAFQATFLVLVRKAAAIGERELVGNWLYGVACRAALEAKAAARRDRERQVTAMPEPAAIDESDLGHDLRPILDQELSRLPDKYRAAVILCDLEGRTRTEAARQFGIPESTLSGRLTTGRRMLGTRLARRGLMLSAGALMALLSERAATAGVPATLRLSTVKAATLLAAGESATGFVSAKVAKLTEGVLKSMLMTKLKVTTGLIAAVGAALLGVGLLGQHPVAAEPQEPKDKFGQKPAANSDVQKVLDKFRDFRPDAKDMAVYQLDWLPTLKAAKEKAAKEQRPVLLMVVHNSYGNLHTGHC